MLINLSIAIESLIAQTENILIQVQIADIASRITDLELQQEGTLILEEMLGRTIGD